ncbi:hypothetical protein SAMN05216204_120104, partial [Massilia yuzhufengensis]
STGRAANHFLKRGERMEGSVDGDTVWTVAQLDSSILIHSHG